MAGAAEFSDLASKLKESAAELATLGDPAGAAAARLGTTADEVERLSHDPEAAAAKLPDVLEAIRDAKLWQGLLEGYPIVRAYMGARALPADAASGEDDELSHTTDAFVYFNELVKEIGQSLP